MFDRLSSTTQLVLPDNIHELLDTALVPADELNALHGNTKKFYLEGFPDLFVRLNVGESIMDMHTALWAVNGLREYGINVLPAGFIAHNDEAFVITKKVTGENLPDALTRDSSLHAAADEIWEKLAKSLIRGRKQSKVVAGDIYEPCQWMNGSIPGDNGNSRIWLVDLPQFHDALDDDDNYASAVLYQANGVISVEKAAGTEMSRAREATKEAISLIVSEGYWTCKYAKAAHYVLEHSVRLFPGGDDETIDTMFAS